MPFVLNCIFNSMQCKQYAIAGVSEGASGREGQKQKSSLIYSNRELSVISNVKSSS